MTSARLNRYGRSTPPVDTLDLHALSFTNNTHELIPGQPAFDPATLLKLYLYGYLKRVRSPAGELLSPLGRPHPKNGIRRTHDHRPASQCRACPPKAVCLPSSGATHRQRVTEQGLARMRQRVGLIEHPCGILKCWLGWDRFEASPSFFQGS